MDKKKGNINDSVKKLNELNKKPTRLTNNPVTADAEKRLLDVAGRVKKEGIS